LQILHVHDLATQYRGSGDQVPGQGLREEAPGGLKPLSRLAMMRNEVQDFALEPHCTSIVSVAQTNGALGDSVEDRLHVVRGTRNDPQDLAGCSPLLMSLG
jgi:hypothetical protein